jgi:hypothetical protein
VLDVGRHGGGVLIRVLGGAVDERIGRREGRRGVDGGSSGSHGGTVEGMMRDVMAVGGRELGRAVGPIRAMMEIHCGRE